MVQRSTISKKDRNVLYKVLKERFIFESDWVEVVRKQDHIEVSWPGNPTVEQVQKTCREILPAVNIKFSRLRRWSCGKFHTDEAHAWEYHALLSGAIPTIEDYDAVAVDDLHLVFPDDPELVVLAENNARWYQTCSCGSSGVEGVSFETLTDLSENIKCDTCHVGEYVLCFDCAGRGSIIDPKKFTLHACKTCRERGIFDMNIPAQAKIWRMNRPEGFVASSC